MADGLIFAVGPPLIYATCGCLPAASTTKKNKLVSNATTLAAGETKWATHPYFHVGSVASVAAIPTMTQHADTDDNVTPAAILGYPDEIETVPLEVPNGTDLSDISVRFWATGRTRE